MVMKSSVLSFMGFHSPTWDDVLCWRCPETELSILVIMRVKYGFILFPFNISEIRLLYF
jgi:hypothetical protein